MKSNVLCLGIHAEVRDASERKRKMMNTISYEAAVADLEAHPAKRIFWRAGWAYRGAGEREISREPHEPKT